MTKTLTLRPNEIDKTLPTTVNDDDAAALAGAARDLAPNDFVGLPLKFVKGRWYVKDGEAETDVDKTEIFVVDPLSYTEAIVCWKDKKRVHRIGGRRVDGFVLPPRHLLPDQDKAGTKSDPWQEQRSIVLRDAHGQLFTWTSTSWGGNKALGLLLDAFLAERHQHDGQYPAVTLSSRDEPNPDYGNIPKPVFTVVGWEVFGVDASPPGDRTRAVTVQQALAALPKPAKAEAKPPARADMDDEIPFAIAALAVIPLLGMLAGSGMFV
jgi:hypothetical protein